MRKHGYRLYLLILCGIGLVIFFPKTFRNRLQLLAIRPFFSFSRITRIKQKSPSPLPEIQKKSPESLCFFHGTLARIIYRSSSAWDRYFWIDLGKKNNREKTVIRLFSPVLVNGTLIGIVDYIAEKQSRVKLITNARLTIPVRVLRKEGIDPKTNLSLDHLLSLQSVRQNAPLYEELTRMKTELLSAEQGYFPGKGELSGSSGSLWRSDPKLLSGKGFNSDFADKKTPEKAFWVKKGESSTPVQEGDWLITSGLEGIFPPDIPIAQVTEVAPPEEGSFSASLKARPLTDQWDTLGQVEVILPTEFQREYIDIDLVYQ